jgi:hypothetical protein
VNRCRSFVICFGVAALSRARAEYDRSCPIGEQSVAGNLLAQLDAAEALRGRHRFDDLAPLHVPFDTMLERSPYRMEAALLRAAQEEQAVAVVGHAGMGKSSSLAGTFRVSGDADGGVVIPIRIPVSILDDEAVQSWRAFGSHLVQVATRGSPAQGWRKRATTVRVRAGAPSWIADVGVEAEIAPIREASADAGHDPSDDIRRIIDLARAQGHTPVVLIDDSDAWVRVAGADRSPRAEAFLTRIVPRLVETLDCGFVLTCHPDYRTLVGYGEALEHIGREIDVPRLSSPEARRGIALILSRRFEHVGVRADADEVFDADALDGLVWTYLHHHRSIRDVLHVADAALQRACADGADAVTRPYIEQAIDPS